MYLTKFLIAHELNSDANVVLNTLTGAVDIVENRYMPYFDDPDKITPDLPIFQALIDRGYLFQSQKEEDRLLSDLFNKYTDIERPTMFVICPTYACNMRCVYCFEGKLTQEQTRRLTVEEVDSIFRAIEKLSDGPASIQLFGGEPFLPGNKMIVSYILDEAYKRGYTISAVTNGVDLANHLPILRKYKEKLIDFQITVDGPADIHDRRRPLVGGRGSFEAIVKSVDAALNEGLRIRLRVNLDRLNIKRLVDLSRFITEKGWDRFDNFAAMLSPVDNHTGEEIPHRLSEDETARLWLSLKQDHPELKIFRPDLFRNLDYVISAINTKKDSYPRFYFCESNNLSCYTFGTDKNVYLCAEAIGDQRTAVGTYHPELILDDEALNKWNGRSIMSLPKCRDCAVATFCGGGCAYAAICINGAIDQPHCNNAEQTIRAYLDSMKDELLSV